jgi:predicted dinucleotide-binding enzyme
MKIGIIGAGHVGGTLAALLVRSGHDVAVANSRGPDSLRELVHRLGPRARAMTAREAAAFGDLVIISIPFGRIEELPAGELAGKLVIDTNNYYPDRDGVYPELELDETTPSELLQRMLPDAHVVKAFNMLRATALARAGLPRGDANRLAIALSGDDPDAKRRVASLIDQLGFDPVDAGDLARGGRLHQQGGPVYGRELTAVEMKEMIAGFTTPEAHP